MLSDAVQKRLTAALFCCKYSYGDLLLIQVCSGSTPVQCDTAFGKMQCSLLSAALQNRLIAGLCCCKYSYGDLLLTQVCSGPTPVQCHTAFGKIQLPPAQCCFAKQADSRLVLLQIQLWRFALDTGVQWLKTSAVRHCFWQNAMPPAQCGCAKQADSKLVLLQIHLWRFALDTGVQWLSTSLFCIEAPSRGQLHFAKSTLALHWCWTTAHLCQEQISTGVFAAKQGCCQPVLHSSTEQGAIAFCQKQCGTALVLDQCTPVSRANLHRYICSSTSLLSACFAQQQ